MTPPRFHLEPLDAGKHDRGNFTCGDEALDRYLATQAGQDMRRGLANVIVAAKPGEASILGYYTLSAASVDLTALPESSRRKLPRYGQVPAVLLGRLAVRTRTQGRGLGSLLLADAIGRALRSELGWAVFLVKAKHERAAVFYRHFGLAGVSDDSLLLWITRKEAERL
jgi:GNAT superfamily N-acetyltransferase